MKNDKNKENVKFFEDLLLTTKFSYCTSILKKIPQKLRTKKMYITVMLKDNLRLNEVIQKYRNDIDICFTAVSINKNNLKYVPNNLRNGTEDAEEFIKNCNNKNISEKYAALIEEWKSHIDEINEFAEKHDQVTVASQLYIPTVYTKTEGKCHVLFPNNDATWSTGKISTPEELMHSNEIENMIVYDNFSFALQSFEDEMKNTVKQETNTNNSPTL